MLAGLPQAVVASVFGFVGADEQSQRDELTPDHGALPRMSTALVACALVSRAWHALARETHCETQLRALHIAAWSKTRRDVLAVRRQLTLRGAVLRRLDVFDLSVSDTSGLWHAALAQAPRLTALRVYGANVGYASAQLAEIVRAAGRCCPRHERLELPPFVNRKPSFPAYQAASTDMETTDDDKDECPALDGVVDTIDVEKAPRSTATTRALVDAVMESAALWKRHQRVGLRHLCLSAHDLLTDASSANAYVSELARNCPGLEVLDGCQAMQVRQGHGEMWTIDCATWEAFSRSCTQLYEFNWLLAPFATRYFAIFGRHEKLKLRKLTIAVAERWNWPSYMNALGVDDRTSLAATGYSATATDAHAMLPACPNLTTLEIQCFFPTGQAPVMSVEQFGDVFCEALATHCRQLTSFAIVPRYGYWTRPGSIAAFTNRSMVALAQLPQLRTVSVTGANFTGDGLYELVVDHARAFEGVRTYEFRLGHVYDAGGEIKHSAPFYGVLERFLLRLANESRDLASAAGRATLLLYNEGGTRPVGEYWLAGYLKKNTALRARIAQSHPTVVLHQTDKALVHRGIRELTLTINL